MGAKKPLPTSSHTVRHNGFAIERLANLISNQSHPTEKSESEGRS